MASKEWVYNQYDYMVRTSTAVRPGSDAAVVTIRGTRKALAMTTDCNGRYVYLDPEVGGKIAVAEAARNVVCSGAEPLAITDNLNFGSPEKPEVFWQMEKAADGMSEACREAGYAGHRRQRQLVQRKCQRRDLPDAGHRHGRPGA